MMMSANKPDSISSLLMKLYLMQEAFTMNLAPLEDRVVLKQLEAETTTASGIVIPGKEKEKPQQAEVLAVGPGKTGDDGKRIPMEVSVGDKVVYSKYSGTEVKIDDVDYVIVKQSDILAIIK